MVPAVTRSANSSLAEAYSEFSARVHRRQEHPTATRSPFGVKPNVNKTCREAVG